MKKTTQKLVYAWLVLGTATLSACAGRTAVWERDQKQATQEGVGAASDELATLEAAAKALWADRLQQDKAEAAVKAMAELAKKAPTADNFVSLSRAHYFLADSHYSLDKRTDDMLRHYEQGLEAGEQALVLSSPAFAQKMKDGAKVEEAIKVVEKGSVPAIYWYAVNLGKWAKAQGLTKMLFYKDKIRAYMTQCLALDENYFHGAPLRYFGSFYAVAPSYAGGDLKKSEESFNKSLLVEPNYLATKVLMAENLAPKKQDRVLFDKLLKEVQAADVNALPELIPEQTQEKKKAEKLAAQAEDLF